MTRLDVILSIGTIIVVAGAIVMVPEIAGRVLNRLTRWLIPDVHTRLLDRQDRITRLLRDYIETHHRPGDEWRGELAISVQLNPEGIRAWASSPVLNEGWSISPTIHAAIHAILFSDMQALHSTQQRLWRRWVQEHRAWSSKAPRYTAHEQMRAYHQGRDPSSYFLPSSTIARRIFPCAGLAP